MSLHRVNQLVEKFGKRRYVDVLKGTALEQHAKDHGFGLYVVRGVLERDVEETWTTYCERMFDQKSRENGGTKLGVNKKFDSTLQAVMNECTCKYNYAGTARHVVVQLREDEHNGVCEVMSKSMEWVNDKLGLERSLEFNELVTNQYDIEKEEYAPWHTDKNPLLGRESLIVSLTLGAPGVFCFAPFYGVKSASKWNHKCEKTKKQRYLNGGVRGCVDLQRGDLLFMCGTFQEHMAHKTLKISRFTESMLDDFPAVNDTVRATLCSLIKKTKALGKYRYAITFRRIVNHSDGSAAFQTQFRCPLRPACGSESTNAPKKRGRGRENSETARGAATEPSMKKRRIISTRPSMSDSMETHQTYIEDELRRLIPDASVGSQRINKFYDYVERVMVVVDEWHDDFELVDSELVKMLKFRKLVYSALAQVKRLLLLNSISVESQGYIDALQLFYRRDRGGEYDVLNTPHYSDQRWKLGMNQSNAKSRTFRVLMPLGTVLDIFDNADIQYFLEKEGVRCHWKYIEARWHCVCNIRRSGLVEVDWSRVGGPYVEVKTLELAADFMTDMTRYPVIPPETSGRFWKGREQKAFKFLRWWRKILVSTKKEQMQLPAERFPEMKFLPWGLPRELNDMPVALWLKRQPNVVWKQWEARALCRWRRNYQFAW